MLLAGVASRHGFHQCLSAAASQLLRGHELAAVAAHPANGNGPPFTYKEKRAITFEEHQKIIAAEVNPERKALYQLCWHLGASQGDIANLKGEDVDWTNNTVSFVRKKTGVPVLVHLGGEALNLFKDLPAKARCSRICRACGLATAPRNSPHVAASLASTA